MPRKSADSGSDVNKTQIIREHLSRNPNVMPKQLADELQKLGYDVKPQHVSTVKFHMKREQGGGGGEAAAPVAFGAAPAAEAGLGESFQEPARRKKASRKKRGRRPRSAQPAAATGTARQPRTEMSFESLRKAKEMADQLGGVTRAKQALDALAQLVG